MTKSRKVETMDVGVRIPEANLGTPVTEKHKFDTGCVRDHQEMARFDLVPMSSLERLALIYSEGAEKYGDYNWQKGMPFSDVLNHGLKHLQRWRRGERDEDHLAKVAWAFFTLMWYEDKGFPNNIKTEGDPVIE